MMFWTNSGLKTIVRRPDCDVQVVVVAGAEQRQSGAQSTGSHHPGRDQSLKYFGTKLGENTLILNGFCLPL